MRVKTIPLGKWPMGLNTESGNYDEPGSTTISNNVRFSYSGTAHALREFGSPSPTSVDLMLKVGYVANGVVYLNGGTIVSTGLADPMYRDYYNVEVVGGGGKLVMTYPSPKELSRVRPSFITSDLTFGGLVGRTGILVVRDGLASEITYTEAPGVTVFVDEGDSVYITRPDGADFYFFERANISQTVTITSPEYHAVLPERNLHRLPIPVNGPITLTSNRLISAVGSVVYYSEPFVYNAYTPTNFYQVPDKVVMVAGLGNNLFIGTSNGVYVVTGVGSPSARFAKVSDSQVLSNSFVRPPVEEIGLPYPEVVVWMTEDGIQFGLPDGKVETPRAGKVKFNGPYGGILDYTNRDFIYYRRG